VSQTRTFSAETSVRFFTRVGTNRPGVPARRDRYGPSGISASVGQAAADRRPPNRQGCAGSRRTPAVRGLTGITLVSGPLHEVLEATLRTSYGVDIDEPSRTRLAHCIWG
jgi:hypothetical protein